MTVRASAAIVVTYGAPCRRGRGAVPYVSARRLTAAGRRNRPPRRSQPARPRPSDELGDLRDRRTGRGRAELPLQDDQIGPGRYTCPVPAWMAGAQPPALLPVSVQRRVELTAVDGTGQVLKPLAALRCGRWRRHDCQRATLRCGPLARSGPPSMIEHAHRDS